MKPIDLGTRQPGNPINNKGIGIAGWQKYLRVSVLLFTGSICLYWPSARAVSPEAETRSRRYVEKGKELADVGDAQGAIFDFTEAIRVDPENAEAYVARGMSRYKQGNTDGAIYDYTEAIEVDARQDQAYFERSKANIKKYDWEGAIEDLAEAIRLKPGHLPYHLAQALLHSKRKNYAGAIEDYDRMLDLLRQGDYDAIVDSVYNEFLLTLHRGQAKFYAGDAEEALRDINKALKLNRRSSYAYLYRADVKFAQGLHDSALVDYGKAIRMDRNAAGNYFSRGIFYYSQDKLPEALADIDKGLRLAEQSEGRDYARLWMWMTRARLGELEQANKALTTQLENRAVESMGDWFEELGRFALGEQSEESLFGTAADEDPILERGQLCEAYFYAAQWQLINGKKEKAVELLERCVNTEIVDFYELKIARGQLNHLRPEE